MRPLYLFLRDRSTKFYLVFREAYYVMRVKPLQAVAQISLVTALMLVGSPVEPVCINEFCVVVGGLSAV